MLDAPTILFLDDCPARTAAFLAREPLARTVTTAAAAIAALRHHQSQQLVWDEIHLDHDLGGKSHRSTRDADTGSEVVRWILLNKPDVLTFIVHTHFRKAGRLMTRALDRAGYRVLRIPFPL